MGCKVLFYNFLGTLAILFLLGSCAEQNRLPKGTNGFIQYFLDQNAERVYKSEIQRVKVNYFPASTTLIYSFWKAEKFKDNGQLFLHLYPTDMDNLTKRRRVHKFVNIPMAQNDMVYTQKGFFYHFQNLQLPFDLASLHTGQYNDTAKTWKSKYGNIRVLKKLNSTRKTLNEGENTKYIVDNDIDGLLGSIIGPKIYEFQQEAIQLHYNASLNTFTIRSNKPIKEAMAGITFFVDSYMQNQFLDRRLFGTRDSIVDVESRYLQLKLPLEKDFNKLVIGKLENETETIIKSLEHNKLIYASYPLKGLNHDPTKMGYKDFEVKLVDQLIVNNLPLVFYDKERKLRLFLNLNKKKAYIVAEKVEGYDALNIRLNVTAENHFFTERATLDNSFYLLGGTTQIVVNEIHLPENVKTFKMELLQGKSVIYQKVYN